MEGEMLLVLNSAGVKECRNCKGSECCRCAGSGFRKLCNSIDCMEHGCGGLGFCLITEEEIENIVKRSKQQ